MNTFIEENSKTNWKRACHTELVKYFHFLEENETSIQFKRVHHYELNEFEINRFRAVRSITKVNISIGLDLDSSTFRAYPILEVWHDGNDNPSFFPMEGKSKPSTIPLPVSELVPGIFKEMVSRNWQRIGMGAINDLFIAEKKPELGETHIEMVRVHFFWLEEKMISHINNLMAANSGEDLQAICLYPGVDMNKVNDSTLISFTPVLGITHVHEVQSVASVPVRKGGEERLETYIEYTSPCPNTCKKMD